MKIVDEYFSLVCPNGSVAGDGENQIRSHDKSEIETNLSIEKYVAKFGEDSRQIGMHWIQFLRNVNNLTKDQNFIVKKFQVIEVED